jgi:hypothetical protein
MRNNGGFQHGGWLVPYFDAKFVEIMTEWTKRAGAFWKASLPGCAIFTSVKRGEIK